MEISEPMMLKLCGYALAIVVAIIALRELLPGFLARRRQRKMDAWRTELVRVKSKIEKVEQKIQDRYALHTEERIQEALGSYRDSVKNGYIARHGRAGSGVNTTHPRVLCPREMSLLTKLLQRRKSLEIRLGIRRS